MWNSCTGPKQAAKPPAPMLPLLLLLPSAADGAPPSGQVFNVYSYGAVGDGVVNDTAAIQR